jgi:hypothetical protein
VIRGRHWNNTILPGPLFLPLRANALKSRAFKQTKKYVQRVSILPRLVRRFREE